jgi:hypothetical protein
MRGVFFGGAVAGFVLGLGLGLAIAWVVSPTPLTGADPTNLRSDLKDDYIVMIASSYSLDGDMARAMQRLAALGLAKPDAYVSQLVQSRQSGPYQQALIHLALDLKQPAEALVRPTYTPRPTRGGEPVRPGPTPLPHPTSTAVQTLPFEALPTLIAAPTSLPATLVPNPDAPLFHLQSRTALLCFETQGRGVIEIQVRDNNGLPLPGIGVEVNWRTGDEVFYTGLKPERGTGYADMEVPPGSYNVRLTQDARSDLIEDLRIDDEPNECAQGAQQVRGWRLVFERNG